MSTLFMTQTGAGSGGPLSHVHGVTFKRRNSTGKTAGPLPRNFPKGKVRQTYVALCMMTTTYLLHSKSSTKHVTDGMLLHVPELCCYPHWHRADPTTQSSLEAGPWPHPLYGIKREFNGGARRPGAWTQHRAASCGDGHCAPHFNCKRMGKRKRRKQR